MSLRSGMRRSLPWAIAIVGGFLSAYLLVAFVIFPSGVIPRDVRVPNVTGLAFDDALRRLAERGLRGAHGEDRFHAASPKGTVLEQDPGANSHDVENAVVTLVVSAGQQIVRVPSVAGLSRDSAEHTLEQAGFDVGAVTERISDATRGDVIESQPAAGAEVPASTAVRLVISSGRGGGPGGAAR